MQYTPSQLKEKLLEGIDSENNVRIYHVLEVIAILAVSRRPDHGRHGRHKSITWSRDSFLPIYVPKYQIFIPCLAFRTKIHFSYHVCVA